MSVPCASFSSAPASAIFRLRNRPQGGGYQRGSSAPTKSSCDRPCARAGLSATDIAQIAMGVRNDRFYILTHPKIKLAIEAAHTIFSAA